MERVESMRIKITILMGLETKGAKNAQKDMENNE